MATVKMPDGLGLEIEFGDVPGALAGTGWPQPWLDIAPGRALLRLAGGAKVLVERGESVTVSVPRPGGSDGTWQWIIDGWVVTLASLQRGRLSLHASTIGIRGRVVALAGERGAGKSTTALGLHHRGHDLLVDDVTVVEQRDGGAFVTPFARDVHLTPEAAGQLGHDFSALALLAGGREKAGLRVSAQSSEPRRLERIVVLESDAAADRVGGTTLSGADRLASLEAHTRRDGAAPAILGPRTYFERLSDLAASVPVSVVRRPSSGWSLPEVMDRIEALVLDDSVADDLDQASS